MGVEPQLYRRDSKMNDKFSSGWLGLVWDLAAKPSVLREESHEVPSDTFHLISSRLVPRASECHELVTKHQHQNRLKIHYIKDK